MNISDPSFIGIIPARYGSSRLPGKPLEKIGEDTLIRHVYERASSCLEEVLVATDDERIVREVSSWGGNVAMTSPNHQSGTDRIAEAYRLSGSRADVVVNIQGDEPFVRHEDIKALTDAFTQKDVEIATLVTRIHTLAELEDPNLVKVAIARSAKALYFSRNAIPHVRGVSKERALDVQAFYAHVGMYAYRSEVLMRICELHPTPLELSESLEQLRWLEEGWQIHTIPISQRPKGIDTPEDLELARRYWRENEGTGGGR